MEIINEWKGDIFDTIQSIDNDINEINIGIEMLGGEFPDDLEYIDEININKISEIQEGMKQRVELLREQIDILDEQIKNFKKIQILEALE